MRYLMRLIAPLVFFIAYGLFRAELGKKSLKKHGFVMRVFRFAADNDSQRALSVYGHLLHFRGDGVQNRIQGAIYLERAATAGDAKAQYQMGRVYESGFEHHFQPDADKALAFYRQAGQQRHPLAVRRMFDVYDQGQLGQLADTVQAQSWQQLLP